MDDKKKGDVRLFIDNSSSEVYDHIIEKLKNLYPDLSIQVIRSYVYKYKDFRIILEITNIKEQI